MMNDDVLWGGRVVDPGGAVVYRCKTCFGRWHVATRAPGGKWVRDPLPDNWFFTYTGTENEP